MALRDILYEIRDGIATITINRPKVLNAFRAATVEELLEAMRDAEDDLEIGVIDLSGAGDRAFAKRSFNADSENIRGIGALGFESLVLYYNIDEAKEGTQAFLEKRRPEFRRKWKRP